MSRQEREVVAPIVQYWHSKSVPAEIAELNATVRHRNPERPYLLFNEFSAGEFIEKHFTVREAVAFRSCAVPAMQADYLRYCAILALGGVYLDVDFRCLQNLASFVAVGGGIQLFQRPGGHLINGAFAAKRPGHPLLRLALDLATANVERRTPERVWQATGPGIFTGLFILHGQGRAVERLGPAGSPKRLSEAFADATIAPFAELAGWIEAPTTPLRYKQSKSHWLRWQERGETIFR